MAICVEGVAGNRGICLLDEVGLAGCVSEGAESTVHVRCVAKSD